MERSVTYRFLSILPGAWTKGVLFAVITISLLLCATPVARAAQTVPYKVNYQGRLTNSVGAPLATGSYNMKFRLFSVGTGGAAVWSETRDSSTQQVAVTNGQFAVQLGDVSALSPSLFTSQPLYLEVELPTPATATCSTAGCASWTEGAMTPRQTLASAAYAMNADTVDGIDGANIATLNGINTFSNSTTFNGPVTFGDTVDLTSVSATGSVSGSQLFASGTSATTFFVQNASSSMLMLADTTNMIVKVGTNGSASLANVRLLSTSAEFNGTVRVGDATNGVDISGANGIVLNGTARRTKSIQLMPEYAGAVLDAGSGSNNTGSMTSKLDLTNRRNYYKWTTTQVTAQSYDVVVQVPIPSDFSAWANTTPITVDTYTSNTTTGTVTLEARDTAGTVVTGMNFSSITPTAATTWQSRVPGVISGTYTAGGYMTLRIRMTSPTSGDVRISNIKLDYLTKW